MRAKFRHHTPKCVKMNETVKWSTMQSWSLNNDFVREVFVHILFFYFGVTLELNCEEWGEG